MEARRSPVVWIGVCAGALLVLFLAIDGPRWVELRITDPLLVVRGRRTVVDCLAGGDVIDCRPVAGGDAVGAWPLAQYVVAVPLVAAGVGEGSALTTLAVVSAAAALAMLALVARAVRALLGTEWAVVLIVALVTGPFVLYALLPFGETVAAFLVAAFVVAACRRSPPWLFILGFLAGITKETAAPFLVVLGIVCARSAADRWLPARRLTLAMVAGIGAAVIANALFNVFRFGTARNLTYTAPATRVPGLGRRFELAIANWFAPNVGVVWFWFLAGVLVAALVVATVALVVRAPHDRRVWAPPAVVVATIAALTAGLASWYSTFGWVAWGPRLTLSMLPAFLIAAIWTAREPMTAGLRWVARHGAALAAVAVLVAGLGAAQVGVVWNRAAIDLPLLTDAACPEIIPIERASPEVFYGCGLHAAWRLEPLALWESARHGPAAQHVAQVLLAVTVACAALWLHARARRETDRDPVPDHAR
jgi:hypothetical protein